MAHKLPLAAALFAGAAGINFCANESAFLQDQVFNTPLGPAGTCGSWAQKMLAHFPLTSLDKCTAGLEVELPDVVGSTTMPLMELLTFMTKPESMEGAGCCGEDLTGSSCAQFANDLPSAPCPEGATANYEDDKGNERCVPCYNKIVFEEDGRANCEGCWGAGMSGCDEAGCVQLGAQWKDGSCILCSSANTEGCEDSDSCESDAVQGNWWPEDDGGRCRMCRPQFGDTYGCTQTQCQETDMRWIAGTEYQRGHCRRCSPEAGDVEGCGEAECQQLKTDYPKMGWSDGGCGMCDLSRREWNWRFCGEQACVASDEHPDVAWRNANVYHNDGTTTYEFQCTRCFSDGDSREMRGCLDQQVCEAASAEFRWARECIEDPTRTDGCCRSCGNDDTWGCQDAASCDGAGGKWCTSQERCTQHDDESCPEDDTNHGCAQVPQQQLDLAYSKGYTPRYCT